MRGINENIAIGDVFVSGLGGIERIGGNCLRFYLYVNQVADSGEGQERVLVAKIVAPASAMPDAVLQMIAAIGDGAVKMVPMVADMLH